MRNYEDEGWVLVQRLACFKSGVFVIDTRKVFLSYLIYGSFQTLSVFNLLHVYLLSDKGLARDVAKPPNPLLPLPKPRSELSMLAGHRYDSLNPYYGAFTYVKR
jgi:hypothetical protein